MNNYLSIDLESWAMPNLPEFTRLTSKQKKELDNENVKNSTLKILEILKKNSTKLTFFIVGQIYEWYPDLVEKIADAGHEIGYHTHTHDPLPDLEALEKSLFQSRKFINRFRPVGFRAPRIKLDKTFIKKLESYGFKYDSSIYGPFEKKEKIGKVTQIPVTSIYNLPIGSGYFIGLFGKNIHHFYQKINADGSPVISFLHNWQIVRPINPSFPDTRYLLTHPHYLPYQAECLQTFEFLVDKFTFKPMKNLL